MDVHDNDVLGGGGSARFLAATTPEARIAALPVTVVRAKDIGIIVGEGTLGPFVDNLHGYALIPPADFYRIAGPRLEARCSLSMGMPAVVW